MGERTVFLNALDEDDPARRRAYLDAACAGDPDLRERVEALLQSHAEAADFLEVPVVEQLRGVGQELAVLGPAGEPGGLGRLDHYEVLEVIGRGATGVVLKARDTKLQRTVALKLLAPQLAANPDARARFVREARAAAAVRDDHVVSIYAVRDEGAVPYLDMEYIAGVTLAERIGAGGALDPAEVVRIGGQLARGLAAAHARGVVHRDIKPGNVLLEAGVGRVKITDFGLALATAGTDPAEAGVIAGTPGYMSPEQARGDPVDYRSDLFSLGSVLYALCTGAAPFRAETTAETLALVGRAAPRPIRDLNPAVPAWLCEQIARLHAPRPEDRAASAQAVADLLADRSAAPGPAPAAPTPSPSVAAARPARPPVGRRVLVVAILGAVLAGLAVLAAVWNRLSGNQPDRPERSERPAVGLAAVALAPVELRREAILPPLLTLAGQGDAAKAPPELAAVLGEGRFLFPRLDSTAWMAQSPDGACLATTLGEEVILFDARDGRQLAALTGPGGRAIFVTFSPDGRQLAASAWHEAERASVRVWQTDGWAERYTAPLTGPNVSATCAFSPDGRWLATEGRQRIDVRDAGTGKVVQSLPLKPGGCAELSFSPDSRWLAASHWSGKCAEVFSIEGGRFHAYRTLRGHADAVGATQYSPDGKWLAAGAANRLKVWKADGLEETFAAETPAQQLAFSPDGRTLFATFTNVPQRATHLVTRWDVARREELPALSIKIGEPANSAHSLLSRDGKTLFVAPGHDATSVRTFDAASGKELAPRPGHTAPVHAVAVSPDGRLLASAGTDTKVVLWDLATGQVRQAFDGHGAAVCSLAFSPDGRALASAGADGTVILWDPPARSERWRRSGHARPAVHVRFSPDGRTLAAGTEAEGVRLLDAATGKERDLFAGPGGPLRCVAFAADGTQLACGGEGRTVAVRDLTTGTTRRLPAAGPVNALAFAPGGRMLAAATAGGVCVWDLATGAATTRRDHAGPVHDVAFAPAGGVIATCGEDGTVRLWRPADGAAPLRVFGPGTFGGPVRGVAFTPDGRYLATANANATVYLLRVDGAEPDAPAPGRPTGPPAAPAAD